MTTKVAVCTHHWLLDTPIAGVGSWGICKRCGIARIHRGGLPDFGSYFNQANDGTAKAELTEARRAFRAREAELRRDADAGEEME